MKRPTKVRMIREFGSLLNTKAMPGLVFTTPNTNQRQIWWCISPNTKVKRVAVTNHEIDFD